MTTGGFNAPPTLDGLHLVGISPEAFEIAETEVKGNLLMADGTLREQRPWLPPGPEVRRRHSFTLDYRHLADYAPAVEALLAFAGPHELAVWKHVTVGYRADGFSAEWFLPERWRLAVHLLSPPPGHAAGTYEPQVKVGFDGAVLSVQHKTTGEYEAGDPAAGEVWFETGGQRFKLEAAPLPYARVIARVVPVFLVVTSADSQPRRFADPIREPRRLVLEEV